MPLLAAAGGCAASGHAGCETLGQSWARWEAGEDFCWCCLPACQGGAPSHPPWALGTWFPGQDAVSCSSSWYKTG